MYKHIRLFGPRPWLGPRLFAKPSGPSSLVEPSFSCKALRTIAPRWPSFVGKPSCSLYLGEPHAHKHTCIRIDCYVGSHFIHVTLVRRPALVCMHSPEDLCPSLGPRLTARPHNFIESAAIFCSSSWRSLLLVHHLAISLLVHP